MVAWSVDVQCDTCQLNIVFGLQKRACEKVASHALRIFTREAYKWIQYIDQVLYSSRYQYVSPPRISYYIGLVASPVNAEGETVPNPRHAPTKVPPYTCSACRAMLCASDPETWLRTSHAIHMPTQNCLRWLLVI
jgi:hypothetical protein